MNCANIRDPSDNSGRLQTPRIHCIKIKKNHRFEFGQQFKSCCSGDPKISPCLSIPVLMSYCCGCNTNERMRDDGWISMDTDDSFSCSLVICW